MRRRSTWSRFIIAVAISAQHFCFAGNQVLYVDADAPPGGDGQTWATALRDINAARAIVDPPPGGGATIYGQVWVAEGVYRPGITFGSDPDPRRRSFIPSNNLAYLGGFLGNETSADQRDPERHVTVLDGDINVMGNPSDNAYNVVFTGSSHNPSAVVDGFTIRNGNANAGFDRGGGWYNEGGKPTVINCRFENNFAQWQGAGMYSTSFPAIIDCEFISNTGPTQGAGGLHTQGSNVTGCHFQGNAGRHGGLLGASLVRDCVFIENSATGSGGGAQGGFEYRDCVFVDNTSNGEAAIDAGMTSQIHVVNCLFMGNMGGGSRGGAIRAVSVSSMARVTNCTFLGNSAGTDGGAIALSGASSSITNCLFSGNSAQTGGAIYYSPGSTVSIINCTLSQNAASSQGGGISTAGTTNVRNCVLWGNSAGGSTSQAAQITSESGTLTLSRCIVQGWTGSLGGTGNHGNDPLFVDALGPDLVAGTDDDALDPQASSPCIDSGDNSLVPQDAADVDNDSDVTELLPWDVLGTARFIDDPKTTDTGVGTAPIVDRGAIEYDGELPPPGPGTYVGPEGGDWFTPSNWAGGAVPGSTTDVVLPAGVIIDRSGAVAATIAIQDGGSLTILGGSLDIGAMAVQDGGALHLLNVAAGLDVAILSISSGATFEWLAGTIRLINSWTHPVALSVGCGRSASLELVNGATVSATSVAICSLGRLVGSGTIECNLTNAGHLEPGASPGSIAIDGAFTQTSGGIAVIEVGGYEAGASHDSIVVDGSATLAGTLEVNLLQGFQPELASYARFLQAGAITGVFENVDLPQLPATFGLVLESSAQSMWLMTTLTSSGPRLYVRADAPEGGDAQSWSTAVNDLQGALVVARTFPGSIDEVWMTAGSYTPDRGTGDRTLSFVLTDGVAVYGGFAGDETELSQRDPVANVTILSGDLAGDDIFNIGQTNTTVLENSYHVVVATGVSRGTILDGLTIRSGNADLGGVEEKGAGILNVGGDLSLVNCTLSYNRTIDAGGAMYNEDAEPTLVGCTFESNDNAITTQGGVVVLDNCTFRTNHSNAVRFVSSSFTAIGCSFTLNERGSALRLEAGTQGTLTSCDFVANAQDSPGIGNGAAFHAVESSPTLVDCHFDGNSTVWDGGNGGAAYVSGGATFDACTFTNNQAGNDGGAVLAAGSESGTPAFTNCLFENNSAQGHGGAVVNGSPFQIIYDHCDFVSNSAEGYGGALYLVGFPNPLFADCTFTNNSSLLAGGGIYYFQDGYCTLDQCVFNGNNAPLGSGIFNRRGTLGGNAVLNGGDGLLNGMNFSPSDANPPSAIGVISVSGDYRHAILGETGDQIPVLFIDITGPAPGTQHDLIEVDGVVQIDGGSLILSFTNGFVPTVDQVFDVVTGSSIVGEFDLVAATGLPPGLTVELSYPLGTVRATVIEGEPVPFSSSPTVPFAGVPTDAVIVDYDRDDYPDIALTVSTGAFNPGNVLVFRNAGVASGEWLGFGDSPLTTAVQVQPASIDAGDLNSDGFPDLAVANRMDSTVSILRNLGGSGFLLSQNFFAGGEAPAVSIGQLAGDALLDFAVVNTTQAKIRIYRNLGDFGFTAATDLIAGPNTTSLGLTDLDGDADLDVVATNSSIYLYPPSTVSTHLSNGSF